MTALSGFPAPGGLLRGGWLPSCTYLSHQGALNASGAERRRRSEQFRVPLKKRRAKADQRRTVSLLSQVLFTARARHSNQVGPSSLLFIAHVCRSKQHRYSLAENNINGNKSELHEVLEKGTTNFTK